MKLQKWHVIFIVVVLAWLTCVLIIAYAQDFDPCFVNNDMFQKVCDKEKNNQVVDDMLERTQQWNNMTEYCSQMANFDECDNTEDVPGYCQGNLTALDREFCNGNKK
jgi:hypothetical protein